MNVYEHLRTPQGENPQPTNPPEAPPAPAVPSAVPGSVLVPLLEGPFLNGNYGAGTVVVGFGPLRVPQGRLSRPGTLLKVKTSDFGR